MKKSIGKLLVLGMTLGLVAGNGQTVEAAKKKDVIEIALITKMVDSPYWQTVKGAAVKRAAELGNVKITHLGPATESDINSQISIVETSVNDGYDGIILAACDKDALITPVEKAVKAKIPVVMIDSGLSEPVYDAFLATNNIQAGANCADVMADLIGGEGKVGIVNFAAGTSTAVDRETGFVNQVKAKYPKIEIVGIQYCDSDPTKAANQATDMISADSDIKGIWGANDQAAVGVANAVENLGKVGKISVVGFDNSADIIAGLDNGTIQGTAVQMPTAMGSKGVDVVMDLLDGKKPASKDVDTGVVMVTLKNLKDKASQAALHQ